MYGLATSERILEGGTWKPADGYCYPNVSAYKKGMPVAFQGSPLKAHADLFGFGVASPKELEKHLALNGSMMDFLKDDARRVERQLAGRRPLDGSRREEPEVAEDEAGEEDLRGGCSI